jgi:Na+/melibiose symporter-like transporter
VLFYYKQVLGLSGTLAGFAIFISVLWDAVSDPLVGAWSDRLRTRWGRRHPMMVASVLPLALSFIALFSPPEQLHGNTLPLFWWLLASVIAVRTSLTFFIIPFLALGAEISSDYQDRTALASTRTNLGWFVGVLVPATSLMLIFVPEGGVDGRFVPQHYVSYGLLSAIGVLLASWICLQGTWRYIPGLASPAATGSEAGMLGDLLQTFKNRNFRHMVVLDIALGGMAGVVGALFMVYYTYFWQLNTTQVSLMFAGPPLVAVLLSTLLSGPLNRRMEKQTVLRMSCIGFALNLCWLTPAMLFGLLPAEPTVLFAIVFGQYALHVLFVIWRTVANHSLLADIVDEHELDTGVRQEGVMFAAAFFAAKFVTGFGYLVAGPFLDLIGLETGMQPGETPASVTWGLGIIMGPALALLMLIPIRMAYKLDLSREQTSVVRAALDRRETAG